MILLAKIWMPCEADRAPIPQLQRPQASGKPAYFIRLMKTQGDTPNSEARSFILRSSLRFIVCLEFIKVLKG